MVNGFNKIQILVREQQTVSFRCVKIQNESYVSKIRLYLVYDISFPIKLLFLLLSIFSNIISGQQTDIGVLTDFTRPTAGVRIIEFESEIGNQTFDVELWDCSGDLEQGKT